MNVVQLFSNQFLGRLTFSTLNNPIFNPITVCFVMNAFNEVCLFDLRIDAFIWKVVVMATDCFPHQEIQFWSLLQTFLQIPFYFTGLEIFPVVVRFFSFVTQKTSDQFVGQISKLKSISDSQQVFCLLLSVFWLAL